VLVAAFEDGENRVVFAGKGDGLRPEAEAGEEFVEKLKALRSQGASGR
jgi:hypothetical protein